MNKYITLIISLLLVFIITQPFARSLTPPNEPKDDSFYICYEKRYPNNVVYSLAPNYRTYKYMGCIISRLPCHLYCPDKFNKHPKPLKQFQWVNTYPKALNSFYRCAYS